LIIGVTSFSQTIYDRYGWKLLESAKKYWPYSLVIYQEGDKALKAPKIQPSYRDFEFRNLFEIPGIVPFLQNIQHIPLAHGKTGNGYNYNFDAWKFSRKAFCQWDAFLSHPDAKVFWLDADIRFKSEVPESFLIDLFEDEPLAFLGREGFYTETGFLGFNGNKAEPFIEKYRECYQKGILFTLPRWHDCQAFDWARKALDIREKNLSPFFVNDPKGNTLEALNVFSKSVLAEFMTHEKGPQKDYK
jgi:hypothetical protein